MTSAKPSATMDFVDRFEEMKHILDALKAASAGEGQPLLVRGEAGSGKTRLVQEAATQAEEQGFDIGFGTALAESVVPYHFWKELLENLGLKTILEEAPPPRLLGLYLIAPDGSILIRVERKGKDVDDGGLVSSVNILREYVQGADDSKECEWAEEQLAVLQEGGNKILVAGESDFSVGAVLEGQEDEKFLADLRTLANAVVSDSREMERDDSLAATEARLRQLLESRKYEGIDYVQHDPKLRQARFFEQVTLGLSRKAKARPLCVAIDDLQWADPSSLALLLYVSRNIRESRVLLLGTYRIEEAEARPHLKDALKGMEQEEILAEMDLKGLSKEYLAELVESFIGPHSLSDAFLDLLWQETRGFPLFVREALLGLEYDGKIVSQGVVKRLACPLDEVALPERVRDVIRERLDRLPMEDRRLLDAAATCGTRFTAALVAKVTGEEEGKALNGLSAIARVHGLLRPTDSGFTFDHPAVQEVAYDGVPTEIRQTYHREAADWLELAGGSIEDIGEHYYRARDRRAGAALRCAASEARAKYANEEAIRFYTEALELEEDAQKRMEMFYGLGRVYDLIADYEKSSESFGTALELTEEKRKRAEIKAWIGQMLVKRGEYDEAKRICTEALDSVEGEECKEEAVALTSIGLMSQYRGENDRALEYFEKSLKISEKMDDKSGIAGTLNNIGITHRERGDGDKALECFSRSVKISKEIGHHAFLANHLNNIGIIYMDRGEYKKALDYYERSLAIKEKIGDQLGISHSLGNIAIVHSNRGDYDKALEYNRRSLSMASRIGNQLGVANDLLNIGIIHRERGDYERHSRTSRRA
ncbi:MAG: tetratricopeptide repeat protein [Thermoplasmata archaeon]